VGVLSSTFFLEGLLIYKQQDKRKCNMNININPYLKFNGNTEETLKFYKSVFGGDFNMVMILFTLKEGL
jgi:hypothetical protein